MERKLRLEGGNRIGPARLPTPSEERQDERKRVAGRPADSLIDDLIIQVDLNEGKEGLEKKIVRWCIACDRYSVGRDAGRIRAHAQQCNVRGFRNMYCIEYDLNVIQRYLRFLRWTSRCYTRE
jgi:hypothetical protein